MNSEIHDMSDNILAFETLYKSHYTSLRSTAHHIISDRDASHDIIQEVFLKLWDKRDELHNILNKKAYLVKSVINASLRYLETKKPFTSTENLRVETSGGSDTLLAQKELEAKINKALNNLPPRCKTIFTLSRFENMKYKEISEHLGISINTVENQMGIALQKLRFELSTYLTKEFLALAVGIGYAVLMRYLLLNLSFFLLLS